MPIKTVSAEQEEAIIAEYMAGATMREAAAKFGYSRIVTTRLFRERGITARDRRVSQDIRDAMVADYLSGMPSTAVAARYGVHFSLCLAAIREAGLEPRSISEASRTYTLNEAFFQSVESEQQAYWLGFITADGCVHNRGVSISLAGRDGDHLHKWASAVETALPVREYTYQGKPYASHAITSARMVADLVALGITERKSHTAQPWVGRTDLMRHYWRGVFDGDGSISVSRSRPTGSSKWTMNLGGTHAIVTAFRSFVEAHTGLSPKIHPVASIFTIAYTGNAGPKAVATLLYGGATIYLDRKFELAQQVLATPIRRSNPRSPSLPRL